MLSTLFAATFADPCQRRGRGVALRHRRVAVRVRARSACATASRC